jgi:hypothetical protein
MGGMVLRGVRAFRRSRVVLGSALVLSLALVASGCGSGYVYAGSAADHVFFRVPSGWALYDTQQMETVERVDNTPAGGRYHWIAAYDADPSPSVNHVLLKAGAIPTHPVVYAYVKTLGSASDQFSLLALRNDHFQVDQAANKGSGDYITYPKPVRYTGGFFGQTFEFQFYAGISALQVHETAVTDPGFQHVYMLLIYCDSLCFRQNQGTIDEIARTWTLRES